MIGKFLSKVFIVALFFLVIYSLFSSVISTKNGFIVVEDNNINRVIKIVTKEYKGYSFVWEGCFPWWFSVYRMSRTKDRLFLVKVTFPELQELKDKRYYFTFPLSMQYIINPDVISDYDLLKSNAKGLEEIIKKYAKGYLQKELSGYLSPGYARNRILNDKMKIINIVADNMSAQLNKLGVKIKNFELTGEAHVPGIDIYLEGLKFVSELREIDKQSKKDLKILNRQLSLNKLKNEELYNKLAAISKIIKKNPDILKYIYIDKISGKSNLVSPIEVPRFFDDKRMQKGTGGDIDNLR